VIARSGTATCAPGANPSAMKRGRRLPYGLLLIALLVGAAILQKDGGAGFPTAPPRSNAQWAHLYAALPLSFEANRGQTDPSVNFLSRGRGYALFLTGREAVLTLQKPVSTADREKPPATAAALRLQLLGANAHAIVSSQDELPGKANYFLGNDPSKWRSNVPTYAKVGYKGVYPGVDLVYYGTQGGELEYDFVVAPGADPKAIALGIETQGPAPLRIDSQGDLVVRLASGDVQLHKPVVYQTEAGSSQRTTDHEPRIPVEGHYALDAQNHVRFELGPYNHNRPLVIDPELIYATYLGGSGGDIGYAIAVDSNLDAYIAGVTNSSNFPFSGSAFGTSYKGNGDCFVTKLNSAGTAFLYSTYVGGSGTDTATAIALYNGAAFITGYTSSTDFPVQAPAGSGTPEPFQMNYGGNTDAFVTQLNTTGSALVYSSYLGGSGADFGQGIAVNPSTGFAYVTGSTQSTNFPTTAGAFQPNLKGSQNAFVTEVNFTGEALLYSTYLGGSQADVAQSIQLDNSSPPNMYIAGYTFSSNFPTVSPIQGKVGSGANVFVSKLNGAGSALTFSTYLGGSGDDRAYGLALDGSQNVYITGGTTSTNFPTTSGAFQPSLHGSSDAFICKLNSAGSSLIYSTYLGGSNADQGTGIAVIPSGASAGAAFVTGYTESTDFPTHNPVQAILGLSSITTYCGTAPCADAFVTELNAAGNALTYSTYLGGNGADFGQAIALDSTGDPYVTGSTDSTNFPAIYGGSYKSTLTGTVGNAFVAKIDSANNTNISIVPSTVNFGNETISVASPQQQITIVNPSTAPLTITSILVGPVGLSTTVFTETDNCLGTIPPNGDFCTMEVTFTPNSTGSVTDQITLTDNAGAIPGTQQTITLTGSGVTAATAVTVQPTSLSFSSQSVGTISSPQQVAVTNTGSQTLNISKISVGTSTDYSETDNCLSAPYNGSLAINQSCTINVSFTPTATGTRAATLSISDNATGSPQVVALTGIGAAAFTLSSPNAVNPTIIGSTQTTFTIEANGPTGANAFTGAITLACSAGTTCNFVPPTIFASGGSGSTSVMTISNLTTSLSNPYLFTVTGTSGSQTTTLQLSLGFSDYTLTASPSSATEPAGTPAAFKIFVNPLNGFGSSTVSSGQQVQLLCSSGLPVDATCTFTPNSTVTPNGISPSSVNLTINTVKYVPPTHTLPRFPNGKLPPLIFGLLSLAGLASLALGNRRRARRGWLGSGWLGVRLATLSLILAFNLALAACRAPTLVTAGSPTGGYTVTVSGTLVSNTAVVRYTTLALAVTQSAP